MPARCRWRSSTTSSAPARPRSTAIDGLRSLILLEDQLAPDRPKLVGEPLAPKAQEPRRRLHRIRRQRDQGRASSPRLFGQLGFRKTGKHRSKAVERWSQGKVELVINCETDGFAHSHYVTHGPGVCAIALDVDDAGQPWRAPRR